MKQKYKWAECYCTHCREKHKDLVPVDAETETKGGKPCIRTQICDRCYLHICTPENQAKHLQWKRENAP